MDSGREILSVRASPRLCQTPDKLPAEEEEEEAAAAAARVPLRARSRCCCCCQKMDPGCTSANYHGQRGKEKERQKEGKKRERGGGVH